MSNQFELQLGSLKSKYDASLQELSQQDVVNRIWRHDHTVWKDDPAEITNRLGWLHSPEEMTAAIPEITKFVDDARKAGFTSALLLGMGGSSLAPEVFRYTFGIKEGYLDLAVLDSTDPGAVLAAERRSDPAKTLYIVSTKSGGTVETMSFMKYFYNKVSEAVGADAAGGHFVAITDPGSGLEALAANLKFRKIFLNNPDIGGRYSALSFFGLLPAALIGMDIGQLLKRAAAMAENFKSEDPASGQNSAVSLGAVMGEAALAGKDKVTLIASPGIASFGAWVEQLIAESTGKEGKGILPVDGETALAPDDLADDRLIVHLKLKNDDTPDTTFEKLADAGMPAVQLILEDLYDLGGEFFRWEVATIIASKALQINPFDQPDVESAKIQGRKMMAAYQESGELPALRPSLEADDISVFSDFAADDLETALQAFLARANSGDDGSRSYVALQAYVFTTPEVDAAMQALRTKIQTSRKLAVTPGYGPRFLHSTGQLHKGDAGHGLFIQITADMPEDAAIPEEAGSDASSITFGVLKSAQALGDRQALLDVHRNVIRFHLKNNIVNGLKRLTDRI